MRPSYQVFFGNCIEGMSDEEHYARELHLCELAEPLGYSAIWCVEHHFDNEYSMCPDNMQLLSYLAGCTKEIGLVTGAIILPWWTQPIRVAEKVALLDHVSKGRFHLGLGRGLARQEYEEMGIDMNEARERFDEAAELILDALETGYAEYDGKYFQQPRARISPAPLRGFRDRLTCVAMSPDSVDAAADIGAGMATFIQYPVERHMPLINHHRERFEQKHGRPAPLPTLTEFVHVFDDESEAEEAREYYARYYALLMRHYELDGGHFADTSGYGSYARLAEAIQESGHETAAAAFTDSQTWGTPDQVVERITERWEKTGGYHLNCGMSFGGMPYEKAEHSMRLFAEEVIPRVAHLGEPAEAAA